MRPFPSNVLVVSLISIVVQLAWGGWEPAAAQDEPGTRIRVDAAEIVVSGRVQMQLNTSSADGVAPTEMLLRRIRFGAAVRINEMVSGRVQPEFAGQVVSLADAYVQLAFSPVFQLIAGKAYRPFAIMEQTGSNQTIPIERGLRIRGVSNHDLSSLISSLRYTDRDVGLMVRGAPVDAPAGLGYSFGVFAGPLQGSVGESASQQYVARVTAVPIDRTRFGLAWTRRDFARSVGQEEYDIEAGDAFALDVEYGGPIPAPGFHLVAEAISGDRDPFSDHQFAGAQLWASYRLECTGRVSLIEPLFRVSHASIDTPDGEIEQGGTLLTPGLNVYLGGLNRVLFNVDLWRGADDIRETSFKTQFQMVF